MRTGIVFSPILLQSCFGQVFASRSAALASTRLFRTTKRHCCPPPIVIDAGDIGVQGAEVRRVETEHTNWSATSQARRASASASRAGWRRRPWGAAGFHQLGSDFADARIAHVRDKLARGETVYLAGLGAPGTHNSGVALVEVTQANGPRLIVNNEEERFSGNKHTTEYPKAVDRCRRRDVARHGPRYRRHRRLAHELGLSDARRHAGALGARGTAAEPETRAHHGGRRLRRPPPRPDDAHAKDPRAPARTCRARAADLPAASRQPRLVFLCRLAVRR